MGFLLLASAVAGWGAGWAGRWLLGWLRRGVPLAAPCCELPVALLWAASVGWTLARDGPLWWLPVTLALAWFGVLLGAVDLAERRLPDALTGAALVVVWCCLGAAAAATGRPALLGSAALGMIAFCAVHLAAHLFRPGALGAGDVKLAATLGAVLGALGPAALALAAVLAALVTAALALGAALARSRSWRDGVPHGPGLLLATWLLAVLPAGSVALAA